jgi:hypothetical protein
VSGGRIPTVPSRSVSLRRRLRGGFRPRVGPPADTLPRRGEFAPGGRSWCPRPGRDAPVPARWRARPLRPRDAVRAGSGGSRPRRPLRCPGGGRLGTPRGVPLRDLRRGAGCRRGPVQCWRWSRTVGIDRGFRSGSRRSSLSSVPRDNEGASPQGWNPRDAKPQLTSSAIRGGRCRTRRLGEQGGPAPFERGSEGTYSVSAWKYRGVPGPVRTQPLMSLTMNRSSRALKSNA